MGTAVAAFESSQVYAIKDLVEKEKIDCDLVITRAVDTFLDQAQADEAITEYKALVERGEPSTKDVCFKVGKEAEALGGVKNAKAAFSFTAGHIWYAHSPPQSTQRAYT